MQSPTLRRHDLVRIRQDFLAKHPNASDLVILSVLSGAIIIEILGREWAEKNIDARRPVVANDVIPRLRATGDEDGTYAWQHRMADLADLLYEAQLLPGFADALPELRTRSLRGVLAELRVAHLLLGSGHSPRLVGRSGIKGRDFDIAAQVGDQSVPVEVKAKEDDTPLTEATVRGTVRKASKQIPGEGPGVVVISIPTGWTDGGSVKAEVVEVTTAALANNRRLNAVVLLWELVLPVQPSGRAFATCYHIVRSESPKVTIPGISDLLSVVAPDTPVPGRQLSFLTDLARGD